LNPGGGSIEAEHRRWGNAVPPRSPLLWPLAVLSASLFCAYSAWHQPSLLTTVKL